MGRPEDYVEGYLRRRCKQAGAECFKMVTPGTRGAPDRLVIGHGRVVFVETKRPRGKTEAHQLIMHSRMRVKGADVRVIDTRELVDGFIDELLDTCTQEHDHPDHE